MLLLHILIRRTRFLKRKLNAESFFFIFLNLEKCFKCAGCQRNYIHFRFFQLFKLLFSFIHFHSPKIKKQILKRFYTYKIVVFSMKKKNHVTYWPHLAPLRILVWNAIRETVVCNLYCVI